MAEGRAQPDANSVPLLPRCYESFCRINWHDRSGRNLLFALSASIFGFVMDKLTTGCCASERLTQSDGVAQATHMPAYMRPRHVQAFLLLYESIAVSQLRV